MNIGEINNAEEYQQTVEQVAVNGKAADYEEAAEKLNIFVAKNIELMRKHLMANTTPDIGQLSKAMIEYMPVLYSLQTLYNKVKFDKLKADQALKQFEAEAYMTTRNEYNNKDTDKKLFLSTTEIVSAYRVKFKATITKLEAQRDLADSRRSFVERLLSSWDSYQYILSNLMKSAIAEANANKLDVLGQRYQQEDYYDRNANLARDALAAQGN